MDAAGSSNRVGTLRRTDWNPIGIPRARTQHRDGYRSQYGGGQQVAAVTGSGGRPSAVQPVLDRRGLLLADVENEIRWRVSTGRAVELQGDERLPFGEQHNGHRFRFVG